LDEGEKEYFFNQLRDLDDVDDLDDDENALHLLQTLEVAAEQALLTQHPQQVYATRHITPTYTHPDPQ
jgi:hypothetical protein